MDMQDDDDIIPLLRNKERRKPLVFCITCSLHKM